MSSIKGLILPWVDVEPPGVLHSKHADFTPFFGETLYQNPFVGRQGHEFLTWHIQARDGVRVCDDVAEETEVYGFEQVSLAEEVAVHQLLEAVLVFLVHHSALALGDQVESMQMLASGAALISLGALLGQ